MIFSKLFFEENCAGSLAVVEVTEYWPEVAGDLSLVAWSHATNSHQQVGDTVSDEATRSIEETARTQI